MNLIKTAMAEGRTALTEVESKQILAKYDVPVVDEIVVQSSNQVGQAAEEIGFPVVVKALGAELTHKTERGLVQVGLTTPEQLMTAVNEIATAAGGDLEGYVVQPQVLGEREFMAGLFTDPQFGPVIMFGIGGVLTEAFEDVAIRLAPLSEADVQDMIEEIKAKPLLGAFRGQNPVDRKKISEILLGLSRLAVENPEISEVDINPLKVGPDGKLVAVDALMILKPEKPMTDLPEPVSSEDVGAFFSPKSIAFIGASATFRKWGYSLPTNLMAGGYEGDIYLVNSKGGKIFGLPAYKSVNEIPGPVDLAVVTIPAAHVTKLFTGFEEKGIRYVLLISSGFGETGPEGKALEKALVEKAKVHNIIILGPNTMGVCNPHLKLHCIYSHTRPEPGSTVLVSQSGNMGTQLLGFALKQGIGIRAFCGSGNEAMINMEDSLDAFLTDETTRTLLLYIESVKNGKRFYENAKRLAKKKPIVVLKGGRSSEGIQAAASHTGAMASDIKVFDAACRQAGIVSVERPMDLLDLSAAFSSLPLPPGNRVAIITLGGGWGVVTADLCAKFGLAVPKLSSKLISDIDKMLPSFWSRSNPIDMVGELKFSVPGQMIEKMMRWEQCDAIIILGVIGRRHGAAWTINSARKVDPDADEAWLETVENAVAEYEQKLIRKIVDLMDVYNKPVVGVPIYSGEKDKSLHYIEGSKFAGVFLETPERAVSVLARMYEYHRFLMKNA